jgi:hypothetical protein
MQSGGIRRSKHTFTAFNPLDGLQLERRRVLATLRFATSLQHRSFSSGYL